MMPDFWRLEPEQQHLWTWLQQNALGRHHAIVQSDAAVRLGITDRHLRDLANGMRKQGWPVVSAREGQMGIFIAATQGELDRYAATMTAIARDLEDQIRIIRTMRPALVAPTAGLFD